MRKKEPKVVLYPATYHEAVKIFSPIYGRRYKNRFKLCTMYLRRLLLQYRFQILLGLIIFFAGYVFIRYVSIYDMQVEWHDSKKPFYLPNIAVMMAAVATAVFTWWKNVINSKQNEIQENTRMDELFVKAVDLLRRENNLMTRKAGVHILRDLAITSPKHTQICIDMLCSVNEMWMPFFLNKFPNFFNLNPIFTGSQNIEDLRVLDSSNSDENFLCKNKESIAYKDDIELSRLILPFIKYIIIEINDDVRFKDNYNLQNKYLCGGDFQGISFKKFHGGMQHVNFQYAYLVFADFNSINLEASKFRQAVLALADFGSAILNNADFQNSDLTYVNFFSAKLEACDFRDLLNDPQIFFNDSKKNAIFTKSDFDKHFPLGVRIS